MTPLDRAVLLTIAAAFGIAAIATCAVVLLSELDDLDLHLEEM